MATKKKAAVKKTTKKKPAQVVEEIFILPNGKPSKKPKLDGNGKKHPAKVFWQAKDTTKKYQIRLENPPKPFKNGPGPFPTDPNGTTQTLTVNTAYPDGEYNYFIDELKGQRRTILSGGGIIIES